jgi:hypothetical protein
MNTYDLHRYIEISDGHRKVASADVTISQRSDGTSARASLHSEAGHLMLGARARLVDAVLDLPELHRGARLEAAFPLGDSETLFRFRDRCPSATPRPAGTSVLLDAVITAAP